MEVFVSSLQDLKGDHMKKDSRLVGFPLVEDIDTKVFFPKNGREHPRGKRQKLPPHISSLCLCPRERWRSKRFLYTFVAVVLFFLFFFLTGCCSARKNGVPFSLSNTPVQEYPEQDNRLAITSSSRTSSLEEVKRSGMEMPNSSSPPVPSHVDRLFSRGPEKRFTSILSLPNIETTTSGGTSSKKEYVEKILRVARGLHRGGITHHPNMYEFLVCATVDKKVALELEEKIREVWREEEEKLQQACPSCFSNNMSNPPFSPDLKSAGKSRGNPSTSSPISTPEEKHNLGTGEQDGRDGAVPSPFLSSYTEVRVRVHSAGSHHRFSRRKAESPSHFLIKCTSTVKSDYFILESPDWHPVAEMVASHTLRTSETSSSSFSFSSHAQEKKYVNEDRDSSDLRETRLADSLTYMTRVLNIALQTLSSNSVMAEPIVTDMHRPGQSTDAHIFKLRHYTYAPKAPTLSSSAILPPPILMEVAAADGMENKSILDRTLYQLLDGLKEKRENQTIFRFPIPNSFSASSQPSFSSQSCANGTCFPTYLYSQGHQVERNHDPLPPEEADHTSTTTTKAVDNHTFSVDWRNLPLHGYGANPVYHCQLSPFYNIRLQVTPVLPPRSSSSSTGGGEEDGDGGESDTSSGDSCAKDRAISDPENSHCNSSSSTTSTTAEKETKKKSIKEQDMLSNTPSPRRGSGTPHSGTNFQKTATVCELLTSTHSGAHNTLVMGSTLHFFQEYCSEWRKLVSPLREDILQGLSDRSVLEEERDISSSLCAYQWLRTFKREYWGYQEKKRKQKKEEEKKKLNMQRSAIQGNATKGPTAAVPRSTEKEVPPVSSSSPLQQFAIAAFDIDAFHSNNSFLRTLKESTRWDLHRMSFEDSRSAIQRLTADTTLMEVYWNTSYQLRAENRWKDESHDVICLPSNKVLWDSSPAMYRTNWFLQSILFPCLQRGTLCVDNGSAKEERAMWKFGRYISLTGKWGKGQFQICFTGGGTHFYDSS